MQIDSEAELAMVARTGVIIASFSAARNSMVGVLLTRTASNHAVPTPLLSQRNISPFAFEGAVTVFCSRVQGFTPVLVSAFTSPAYVPPFHHTIRMPA